MKKTVLLKKQLKDFYTFVTIIKPYFSNFSIQDGIFRMRSDDSANIVETEFNYFKNMNLTVFDTKMFAKTLSKFKKNIDTNVIVGEEHITFKDKIKSVQVPNEDLKCIKGQFINNEEMSIFLKENYDSAKPFIKELQPKYIVLKINQIIRKFSLKSISIKHNQNDLSKGYFYIARSENEDWSWEIKLRASFLTSMKKDHSFNFSSLPFIFNKSDMAINFCINKEEILFLSYTTKVGNLLVNIYGRAAFTRN
jgi:hypothetical protein